MENSNLVDHLFMLLAAGDRRTSRSVVSKLLARNVAARDVIEELFWPVLDRIQTLYREDQLSNIAHHYATRLLRTLVDQVQPMLEQGESNGQTVLVTCGPDEPEEIAGQMACDLLEAEGYQVYFCGGGVANDEIIEQISTTNAHVLLVFGAAAASIPPTRLLIDELHNRGVCPKLQVGVGGGVFNRAAGLAEEIGADIWAYSPQEMVQVLQTHADRRMALSQRTVGRRRKARKVQNEAA
ncbi:MAG: B12-binding domain-containing protein [Phycisphaeraceae bacterium]|nr:B12-binding domain-containing protein [Phycisphaeraceae bacterium]